MDIFKKKQPAKKQQPVTTVPTKVKFLLPKDLKKVAGGETLQFAYDRA